VDFTLRPSLALKYQSLQSLQRRRHFSAIPVRFLSGAPRLFEYVTRNTSDRSLKSTHFCFRFVRGFSAADLAKHLERLMDGDETFSFQMISNRFGNDQVTSRIPMPTGFETLSFCYFRGKLRPCRKTSGFVVELANRKQVGFVFDLPALLVISFPRGRYSRIGMA